LYIQSDNVLAFQVINFIDDEILERFTLQRFPLGCVLFIRLRRATCPSCGLNQ
jgi:hypothetical protein